MSASRDNDNQPPDNNHHDASDDEDYIDNVSTGDQLPADMVEQEFDVGGAPPEEEDEDVAAEDLGTTHKV